MATASAEIESEVHDSTASEVEEARVEWSITPSWASSGATNRQGVPAFDCDVFGRRTHPSRSQKGEQSRDHAHAVRGSSPHKAADSRLMKLRRSFLSARIYGPDG